MVDTEDTVITKTVALRFDANITKEYDRWKEEGFAGIVNKLKRILLNILKAILVSPRKLQIQRLFLLLITSKLMVGTIHLMMLSTYFIS